MSLNGVVSMMTKSGVFLKQARWLSLALWENCGEESYGGGDGNLVVVRRFKQVLARICKLGYQQHVPGRAERSSCPERKWGRMGKNPPNPSRCIFPL